MKLVEEDDNRVKDGEQEPGLWRRRTLVVRKGYGQATRRSVVSGVLAVVAIAVPILNQVVPASSALHLSAYGITLIGKYLCYAMLALARRSDLGLLRHPQPRATRRSFRWAATRWACI